MMHKEPVQDPMERLSKVESRVDGLERAVTELQMARVRDGIKDQKKGRHPPKKVSLSEEYKYDDEGNLLRNGHPFDQTEITAEQVHFVEVK
jgi:hypothetical protein